MYLLILGELILILLIIAKVWHDQRTFHRTGILPWCSRRMPRLPCDAMLERIKEPPNFNRHNSAASSALNVQQPSVSHIELRGSVVGGSGSIASDRSSRSIQPQSSNQQSSHCSRTSSV